MTRFMANSAMRKKGGQKRDRPEEKMVYEILEYHAKYNSLKEQVKIVYKTEQNRDKEAIVDILLLDSLGAVVIRINGDYHEEPSQEERDELQKLYLERDKYIIVDFDKWKYPILFKRNKRKLTRDEAYTAYNELRECLVDTVFLPSVPKDEWLAESKHIKKPKDS